MNKSKLARDLSISRTMLYKLIARGMPAGSLDAAIEWRRQNLDVTQTKGWRIDGNKGVNRALTQVNSSDELNESLNNADVSSKTNQLDSVISEVLTHFVPDLWFGNSLGILAGILRDHDITISGETLFKVQGTLLVMYMNAVDETLESEADFRVPDCLMLQPGMPGYSELISRIDTVLNMPKQNIT